MGGLLAMCHNDKDMPDIKDKIQYDYFYWLRIKDLARNGEYASLTSDRKMRMSAAGTS